MYRYSPSQCLQLFNQCKSPDFNAESDCDVARAVFSRSHGHGLKYSVDPKLPDESSYVPVGRILHPVCGDETIERSAH